MKSVEISEDDVLIAIYQSGLHQYNPAVLKTKWKDGIDVSVPSIHVMNFAQKLIDRFNQKEIE
jgi:hypothetical protein